MFLLFLACASRDGTLVSTGARHETSTDSVTPAGDCEIASSSDYGYSLSDPIRVGGGWAGANRTIAVLEALRGPDGQGTQFHRVGTQGSPEGHLVDLYELTYAGLKEPIVLYVDQYSFEVVKTPQGLSCTEHIVLPQPEALE